MPVYLIAGQSQSVCSLTHSPSLSGTQPDPRHESPLFPGLSPSAHDSLLEAGPTSHKPVSPVLPSAGHA